MDVFQDTFTTIKIPLKSDYEGDVEATLLASSGNQGRSQKILFVHGFADYFFHDHVRDRFHKEGYDFFAIDLRKYGRSYLPHQHLNYCRDIHEYFEELDFAIKHMCPKKGDKFSFLAHSTGALISGLYAREGKYKDRISSLVFNSPFVKYPKSKLVLLVSPLLSRVMSSIMPYSKLNKQLKSVYARGLHKDYQGSWEFNKQWKATEESPTYYHWINAVFRVQKVLNEKGTSQPCLVMHSNKSGKHKRFSPAIFKEDIVLNVKDMIDYGERFSNNTTLVEIKDSIHDLFLSSPSVREHAFSMMFSWLNDQWEKELHSH